MDNATPDDEGLWDELSHQQSREIQQHHSRIRRNHTVAMMRNAMQQTATAVSAAASTAAERWTAYQGIPTTNHNDMSKKNLNDFGLDLEQQSPRGDPLLDPSYGYQAVPTTTLPNNSQASSSRRSQKDGFVFLNNFRLLPKRDGWGAVANLDLFFASLYNYYYHRGFMPILGKGIVELVSLFLTLWLSVFLFAYLNWKALTTCTDEHTCHADFHEYIIEKPFAKASLWNFIMILYTLLFICYGIFAVWSFFYTVRDAWDSKRFFEERLGISARKLEGGAVEWDRDVVARMLELQQSGEYRIAIHGQGNLDALVVAQRILRKENFLIAFFNIPMLDLTVPCLNSTFFCKSLEWSLYFCVLNYMFNHKYQIRPAFYLDPSSLKRRFIICGVAHAVFMPFLLFFMTLHFSMSNVYDWKSTKKYLGPREWSLSAKWTMREFNELPHFFERRLGPSYQAAETYLKLFTQSPIMTALGRIMVFIGGSLGVVLLVFAAINDSILLHVKIGDWNLLWYVGIFGVIYSSGKSMLPDPDAHPKYTRNLFAEMDGALAQVTTHTHHYPDAWKGRGWRRGTYKAFSSMFKYKAQLFVMEVMSVVMAPMILCVSLPKCAEHICEVVMQVKTEVPGAGDVCGFATFDFDKFHDENWEGRTMGENRPDESTRPNLTGSVMASAFFAQSVETARALHPCPKTRQGKMEKSFFSFKAAHPTWKCCQSGQNLVDRVAQYQHNETLALARERQAHMEAAARQLETLSQLEKRRLAESMLSSPPGVGRVDESYIAAQKPPARAPASGGSGADSGGGGTVPAAPPHPLENAAAAPLAPSPTSNLVPPLTGSSVVGGPQTDAFRGNGSPSRVHFDDSNAQERSIGRATPPPFASAPEQPPQVGGGATTHAAPQAVAPSQPVLPPSNRHQVPTGLPPPSHVGSNSAATASVLHYADVGLSTELRRILNRSTLEADVSAAGSVLGGGYDPAGTGTLASVLTDRTDEDIERTTERQYLWLERYHSYLAGQQQQREERNDGLSGNGAPPQNATNLSASDGMISRGGSTRSHPTGGNNRGGGGTIAMSSMV